jgi:DNA-binding MarR family transcriptional regulator
VVLGRLLRRLRAEHRFPIGHGAVLGRLDREGPLTTAALAAAEKMRPQSMGQTIAELEAQGFVSRRPDAHDGRRKLLELTAAGREVLADDRRRRVGWLAEAIDAELTGEERDVLRRAVPLLERLAEL